MYETGADKQYLQQLIDKSINKAGVFLKRSFEMPEHSLSAEQFIGYLNKKITVSLATVSKNNAPRVAPIGAIFYRGHFCIPTLEVAARSKMLRRNPNTSLSYYEDVDLAIIIHGQSEFITPSDDGFQQMDAQHQAIFGNSVADWGDDAVYLRVLPDVLFTYARYIEKFK